MSDDRFEEPWKAAERKSIGRKSSRRQSDTFLRKGKEARRRIEELGYPATTRMTLEMMAKELE